MLALPFEEAIWVLLMGVRRGCCLEAADTISTWWMASFVWDIRRGTLVHVMMMCLHVHLCLMVESIRGWLREWHMMGLSRGVGEGKYVEGCWRGQMLLGIEARGQHDSSSWVLHRRVLRVHALVSIT